MITRIQSLRLYLRPFQCSLGRRLSLADIELLGPIERHRRLGCCSPWIVHDHPDRPGSLPLLRKYLQWVIDYTGIDYPEVLFEPPPRAPDSYRGCNFDHVVFTRCRFTLHRDRYDRCTRVFIPQLSPGRLFILHFVCAKTPWVSTPTNTSRHQRHVPSPGDKPEVILTLREQRHAVVGKSSPAPHCPFSLPLPVIDPEMNLFILLTITHSGAEVFRLR